MQLCDPAARLRVLRLWVLGALCGADVNFGFLGFSGQISG